LDERTAPVVANKITMYRPLVTTLFVMIIVSMVLLLVVLYLSMLNYLESGSGYLVFLAVMVCLTFPMLYLMGRSTRVRSVEDSIVLDVDRLRSFRGGRVLMDLPFDPRTRVDFRLYRDSVSGRVEERFFFHRGWWVYPICAKDYSPEDFSRILPVVEAGVRKHGMPAGKSLTRIMEKRGT